MSEIPNAGKGLFTAIKIFKDEIIAVYRGEIITDSEAEIRINQLKDQYFIVLLDGQILDSKNSNCFAKYANDAEAYKNRRFINNAKIGLDESDNVCLIAKKNIPSGSEIFCSYGKSYWKKHGKLNLKNN